MKHLPFSILLVMLSLALSVGCSNSKPKEPKVVIQKVEKGPKLTSKDIMKVAFVYPVIAVDNQKVKGSDDPFAIDKQRIVKEYKKNSTNDITITFLSSEGEEKVIHGTIKVSDYRLSKPGIGEQARVVLIDPDNELAYEDILRNGYGTMVASEIPDQTSEEEGAELVQLTLGSRKKKKSDGIEFHFREGLISSVNDKYTPYNLTFPENSKQKIQLALDEGLVVLQGDLEIYKSNEYTKLAPVWLDLDLNTRETLRSYGGQAKIAISVPDENFKGDHNVIVPIVTGQDPVEEGSKFGTVVAVLSLRKVSELGY